LEIKKDQYRGVEVGIKKIILILVILPLITAGCLGSNNQEEQEKTSEGGSGGGSSTGDQKATDTPDEVSTAGITSTEGANLTPAETGMESPAGTEIEGTGQTGTPSEVGSPEIQEDAQINSTGAANQEGTGTGQQGSPSNPYLVRLKDFNAIPSSLEIKTGDSVAWRNFQESTVLFLTSKEGLFEDQRLGYGQTFVYTFTQPGKYSFSVEGYPRMEMTITVK
jgi:plastocyanin